MSLFGTCRGWLWESLSIARERLRVQEVEEGERDVPVIIEQCLKEVALQKRGERDILEQWVEVSN